MMMLDHAGVNPYAEYFVRFEEQRAHCPRERGGVNCHAREYHLKHKSDQKHHAVTSNTAAEDQRREHVIIWHY